MTEEVPIVGKILESYEINSQNNEEKVILWDLKNTQL